MHTTCRRPTRTGEWESTRLVRRRAVFVLTRLLASLPPPPSVCQAKGEPFAAVMREGLVADRGIMARHFRLPSRQVGFVTTPALWLFENNLGMLDSTPHKVKGGKAERGEGGREGGKEGALSLFEAI